MSRNFYVHNTIYPPHDVIYVFGIGQSQKSKIISKLEWLELFTKISILQNFPLYTLYYRWNTCLCNGLYISPIPEGVHTDTSIYTYYILWSSLLAAIAKQDVIHSPWISSTDKPEYPGTTAPQGSYTWLHQLEPHACHCWRSMHHWRNHWECVCVCVCASVIERETETETKSLS